MASVTTIRVLAAFLREPEQDQYGFGLMRLTGLKAGSLYPLLARLHQQGWLRVHDEEIDEVAAGRPKRRLYRLTPTGEREARYMLAELYRDLGPAPARVLRPEGA